MPLLEADARLEPLLARGDARLLEPNSSKTARNASSLSSK